MSKGENLCFLVDSGADIILLKSKKLLGTVEYEPKDRVRVNIIDSSIFETHGDIKTRIKTDELDIPFRF